MLSFFGLIAPAPIATDVFNRIFLWGSMAKQNLRVLLIEDSPEYAELVHRWLAPKDEVVFTLNWADSLMQGLNSLAQGGVDVILLDLGLPDSSGHDTFTTARAYARGVPVIVLSGGDSESLALRMVQEGLHY